LSIRVPHRQERRCGQVAADGVKSGVPKASAIRAVAALNRKTKSAAVPFREHLWVFAFEKDSADTRDARHPPSLFQLS
jgi:hypothetical protein